ncbi:MAG: HlyC/CorC family transporter [Clostridia bacterium]|nr:HlyC/CorC family transporter [Clostridia bacterium]
MGLWIALICCIALSGFFSATETAFSASSRIKLKTIEGEQKPRAQTALRLLEEYDSLLTTVLVGNNVVNIAGTAIATILFTRILQSEDTGATVASAVMTAVVLFFGEVGPKTLAKQQPERFAMAVSPVIRIIMKILTPVDWLFGLWRKLLSKIVKAEPEEPQIEEELMTMIDEAQTEGDIEAEEGELIRSAIEFNDQDAEDIMTPRVDVTAVADTATVDEVAEIFRSTFFSRIPVYHEDLDHIVGILHEKDFYKMTHDGENNITRIMKEPVFAPATLPISSLLKQFRASKTHQIILLDEFGGTDGIVTLEDVLEELVGEIYDEHDEVNEEVIRNEDGSFLVDGGMQLQDMLESLGMENNDYDADTVGGWVGEMIQKVPENGDRFTVGEHQFTVMEMDGFRVTRVKTEKTEQIEKTDKNDQAGKQEEADTDEESPETGNGDPGEEQEPDRG